MAFRDIGVAVVISEDWMSERTLKFSMVAVSQTPHLMIVVQFKQLVHMQDDGAIATSHGAVKTNQPGNYSGFQIMRVDDVLAEPSHVFLVDSEIPVEVDPTVRIASRLAHSQE